ncbi:SGNH/GDSL hydrolase family protein [Desulfotalea psychrophila]|uniref:SGNH hydrolase-type esterase domain-containing protein n=1 Tax=Desulfotalea psychrophila (strain LSv54 / DSM 12343) TaxID=177439 RepID=Q6AS77_DESPS|nr:SGNH/GDSL hydrolase family protein [Desulfotalea psychrophila]CAG34798.1 unknown protein [Desulfotalea psychrophila LSv54]
MAQLLFIGDSLIEGGAPWSDRIPQHKIESLGIPGARTDELLARLPLLTTATPPDLTLISIGTNNIYQQDLSFHQSLQEIILFCRKNFPSSKILLENIFPMHLSHITAEQIEAVNRDIALLARQTGSCLLDMHAVFTAAKSENIFQQDNIHLTERGYAVWTRKIQEHVAFLIEAE